MPALPMRPEASVLHLDLDSFFASVEQRDKPSLRGKPVVVGGTGGRGVVATASYEARAFGVRSAMSTREARSRCPHAAFLSGRFGAYRAASTVVMDLLRELSPLVEPLSLDEAFVDLRASTDPELTTLSPDALVRCGEELRERVREATGGLTASVGLASSKFLAKIASELRKPDGLSIIEPGTEQEVLRPMRISVIPGVGPATTERLHRIGMHTCAEVESLAEDELVQLLGRAQGRSLYALVRGIDDRPVVAEREAKSVSVEGTYDQDLTDRSLMAALVTRQALTVSQRLAGQGLSGRTVQLKVRLHDFTTFTRSSTLAAPTDDAGQVARTARALLEELHAEVDTSGGIRLLGVGVSGLADWVQDDLFSGADAEEGPAEELPEIPDDLLSRRSHTWATGNDVVHARYGRGWVWGSGRQVVTVRFETADTPPGPVRSFRLDDPELSAFPPPEVPGP